MGPPSAGCHQSRALYGGLYLVSGRSLMPAIASHALTDLVIEPWLILAALRGALVAPATLEVEE